jgi:hypothetical protein
LKKYEDEVEQSRIVYFHGSHGKRYFGYGIADIGPHEDHATVRGCALDLTGSGYVAVG